jgi:cell pole-organizing protein PopZ
MDADTELAAKEPDRKPDNTGDIISAIRRIMEAEQAVLEDDPDAQLLSDEAQKRVLAALDRLTGGSERQPTVLEALTLEALEPVLSDWLSANLPPMVERLLREEIRALLARSETQISIGEPSTADT